jgi:putative transposase
MLLTYKYRLKDRSARKLLEQYSIAVNGVWNYCVAYQRDVEARYKAGAPKRKWPTSYDFNYLTSGSSKEVGIHAGSIQETCRYFVVSRGINKRTPRFRSNLGAKRSLGWVPFRAKDYRIDGNAIVYLGHKFRFFGHKRRPLCYESAKAGSFNQDASGGWWVNISVEVTPDCHHGGGIIGVDLGLKSLATFSDGTKVDGVGYFRKYQQKLAISQKARKRERFRAIHRKIVNCRKDRLHKMSSAVIKANSRVVVGNISGNKLAKTSLAKSVYDVGFSSFRSMLKYKAIRHSVEYIEVDERFTSQLCSACGIRSGPKGIAQLGIREWECSECGANHDRDVNAAKNILKLGQSVMPLAEGSCLAAQSSR